MLNVIEQATDEAAVQAVFEKIVTAFNNCRVEDLITLHTDDFVLMDPGKPTMYGKEIGRHVFARFKKEQISFHLSCTIDEIQVSGHIAFVRGTVSSRMTKGNAPPVHDAGRFLSLFRKQPAGNWLRSHVMVNKAAADEQPFN